MKGEAILWWEKGVEAGERRWEQGVKWSTAPKASTEQQNVFSESFKGKKCLCYFQVLPFSGPTQCILTLTGRVKIGIQQHRPANIFGVDLHRKQDNVRRDQVVKC